MNLAVGDLLAWVLGAVVGVFAMELYFGRNAALWRSQAERFKAAAAEAEARYVRVTEERNRLEALLFDCNNKRVYPAGSRIVFDLAVPAASPPSVELVWCPRCRSGFLLPAGTRQHLGDPLCCGCRSLTVPLGLRESKGGWTFHTP